MKATLKVVNQMQADGVIGNYAIGGAIGATFYLEPTATFDIDIFVSLKNVLGSPLVSLEPIYSYLNPFRCRTFTTTRTRLTTSRCRGIAANRISGADAPGIGKLFLCRKI